MKSNLKQNLLNEANAFGRRPELKTAINDYKENDTAQIFDVFLRGFRAAVEFQLVNKE